MVGVFVRGTMPACTAALCCWMPIQSSLLIPTNLVHLAQCLEKLDTSVQLRFHLGMLVLMLAWHPMGL